MIAAIPLGGYVKMLDEREGEVAPAELEKAHNRKPVLPAHGDLGRRAVLQSHLRGRRVLAVLVIGKPDFQPIVAEPSGLAAAAGFQSGDRIVAIGDEKVATWTEALRTWSHSAP